jgi:DNA-binding transcriptional LysR family regulator
MDTETLRLFVAACELGNFSQLARRENLSAPTITRRIQQLEVEMGASLLVRAHKGVKPTPEGRLLLEKSATLLSCLHEISQLIPRQPQRQRAGVVSVIGSYSMTAGRLLTDIDKFLELEENKDIRIQLKEGDKQTIADELRTGAAELGIFWNVTDTSGLELFTYHRDQIAAVMSAQHPLASVPVISYAVVAQHESVRTKTTRHVELMLERTGGIKQITQKNRVEVPSFEALLRLVKTGRYVGLCPAEVAAQYEHHFDLKIRPLSDGWASRNHVIACNSLAAISPAARALLDHLLAQPESVDHPG